MLELRLTGVRDSADGVYIIMLIRAVQGVSLHQAQDLYIRARTGLAIPVVVAPDMDSVVKPVHPFKDYGLPGLPGGDVGLGQMSMATLLQRFVQAGAKADVVDARAVRLAALRAALAELRAVQNSPILDQMQTDLAFLDTP